MIAWRLCRRPHSDLSGEGARRFGGRWNTPGRAVVYLAEHPALAALEVRVHLDLPFDLLPVDFVLMQADVPYGPAFGYEWPAQTAAAGDNWLTEAASATMRVPSFLVPHAWNIIMNPLHRDAVQAEIRGIEPFLFDPRLWRPLANEG